MAFKYWDSISNSIIIYNHCRAIKQEQKFFKTLTAVGETNRLVKTQKNTLEKNSNESQVDEKTDEKQEEELGKTLDKREVFMRSRKFSIEDIFIDLLGKVGFRSEQTIRRVKFLAKMM